MATTEEILEESTRVAQEAAGVIGGTFEQGVGFTPNDNITSDTLADTPNLEFTQPDTTPDFDISGLNTDLPETPQADKADDFVTRFGEIQGLLGGEEEFRQQQREETGVSGLRTTQEDLVSQIEGFQIQAKNLANQRAQETQRIQLESEGRGRTVSGIRPLTASALRKISIQQSTIASQALTASATLNAVAGRLVTARRQIEEAVQKRFGPLKAEKQAIIENLDLLIRSGTLNREEKVRATAQKEKQEAEREQIEAQEAEQEQIWNIAVQAAQTIGNLPNGSVILDQIQNAPTKEQALAIATANGAFVEAAQNTFTQRLDANGNLIELELDPTGRVVNQRVITEKVAGDPKVKEPTGTQRVAAGFALRAEDSGRIITELGSQFTGAGTRFGLVPEAFKSEDRKSIEQAERNFVNAILRRESGAAIAPTEFESAQKQYFAQRGDSNDILLQKQRNREVVTNALRLEGGDAFTQLKASLPPIQQKVTIGNTEYEVGTIIENSKGDKARVNADGTLTFI